MLFYLYRITYDFFFQDYFGADDNNGFFRKRSAAKDVEERNIY